MADQQKATSLPHYGNTIVRAPTLERLAGRGLTAENFYIQNPLCAPSRACFHTGRYPQALRMFANAHHLPSDETLLAEVLKDAGYRTGAVGHVHSRGGLTRGYDFVDDMDEGRLRERWRGRLEIVTAAPRITQHMTSRLPYSPQEDVDGLMTASALSFLDAAAADPAQPFFLHVAWIAPHPPYFVTSPYAEMYDPDSLALPTVESADQNANKPPSYLQTAIDSGTYHAPDDELRTALAYYYGMCTYLDDLTAQLVDRLERHRLLDNTIVVYTSDHGDFAAEHRMFGKSTSLYDSLIRVPFILSGPDHLIPQGERLEGFVESVDLFPTLLELTGTKPPTRTTVHGHSLRPRQSRRCRISPRRRRRLAPSPHPRRQRSLRLPLERPPKHPPLHDPHPRPQIHPPPPHRPPRALQPR
jgi:arylsulfatase